MSQNTTAQQNLSRLTKADLQEQYKTATGQEADEDLTKAQLIAAINGDASGSEGGEGLSATQQGSTTGVANQAAQDALPKAEDDTILYPTLPNNNGEDIPAAPRKIVPSAQEKGNEPVGGGIRVRQWQVSELNGGMVKVPNTEREQVYTQEALDNLVNSGFFEESKMGYEIIK